MSCSMLPLEGSWSNGFMFSLSDEQEHDEDDDGDEDDILTTAARNYYWNFKSNEKVKWPSVYQWKLEKISNQINKTVFNALKS